MSDGRKIDVSGLGGTGPRMQITTSADPVKRMAELLANLIELVHIHPRVLGIPDGDGSLPVRIERYLRG